MRRAALIGICAMTFAAPAALAQETTNDTAQPKETLSHFLSRCDTGDADCRSSLRAGIMAGEDMEMTCLPDGTSEDQAVEVELTWLHNAAAANTTMANDAEDNGEFTALNMLWPCSK